MTECTESKSGEDARAPKVTSFQANDQQPMTNDSFQIPPSKIFFDKYRSAESGITVTMRFPAPSLFATCIDANTLAPPLDPENTPSLAARLFTVLKAVSSLTIRISSQTDGSKFFGTKLAPMPSTLCLPGAPPPSTEPCVSTATVST